MAVLALAALVIVTLYTTAYCWDRGAQPRSRGSFRYQRRKARRLSLSHDKVVVRARNADRGIPAPRHGKSHVDEVNRAAMLSLLLLVGLPAVAITGGMVMYAPKLGWPLAFVVAASGIWLLWRRRA